MHVFINLLYRPNHDIVDKVECWPHRIRNLWEALAPIYNNNYYQKVTLLWNNPGSDNEHWVWVQKILGLVYKCYSNEQ